VDLCTNQLQRGGALAVAKAVLHKPALKLLALDDNAISESGIEALKALLNSVGKLEALGSLEENCPEEEEEYGAEDEGHEELDAAVDALAAGLMKEHISA